MSETIGSAQVELGVDDTGVEAGVARAKKSIATLGGEAAKAGKAGSDGVAAIGKAGAESADKLDAATKRTIASIERQTLAMGKSRSEYYAAQAAIAGNSAALAPYIAKMGEAERAAERLADRQQMLASAKMAVGFAAAAATAAVVASIKGTIDAADALDKLRQATGTSVENLAGLKYAAEQNGVALEDVAKAGQKLAGAISDKPELFRKLGISAKDSTGAMIEIADVFASMPDGIEKNALAVQLFGEKLAEKMIPFLNQGSDSLRTFVDEGKRLVPITTEMARQAANFNDQLDKFKASAGSFGIITANSMLPAMNDIIDGAVRAQKEYGTLAGILAAVGLAEAKLAGVEINPENRRKNRIDELMVQRRSLNADVADPVGRGGFYFPEKFKAGAREKLTQVNAELKALVDEQNALIASAGKAAEAKRAAEEKARAGAKDFKDGLGNTKSQLSDYDKLIAKLKGELVSATVAAQSATQDYTKSQQEFLMLAASPEWAKMSEVERIRVAGLYEGIAAQELATETVKKAKKADDDAIKSEKDYIAGIGKTTEELLAKAAAAEAENATIGLTAEQLSAVTAARYDEQIAIKTMIADAIRGTAGREGELAMIELQVAALERLKNAEVTRPALQAQADAWTSFAGDIRSSLTDAIQRGLEKGGKDGAQVALDTIKNTLKTIPIKILTEMVVNPVMGGIQGVMQGGASGGASGNGAMDYLSAGQSVWSGISGAMATNMGNLAISAGNAMGSAAVSEFGAGLTISGAGGSTAGLSTAAQLGSTVATVMPYVAAALAAYSLFGGPSGPHAQSLGETGRTFDASGNQTGSFGRNFAGSQTSDAFVQGMQAQYASTIASLGGTAAASQFSFGAGQQSDGTGKITRIYGGAGSSTFNSGELLGSDPAAVQLAASRAVFSALQGSQLPDYLRSVFDGLTASGATQEQITNTLQFAQSLKSLRDGLSETRTPLEIAQAQMSGLSAEFHTSATTFKTDFVAAIDAGITPATIARWQQLGQSIDQVTAATDASQSVMAKLAEHYGQLTDAQSAAAQFSAAGIQLDLPALLGMTPDALRVIAQNAITSIDPATASGQALIEKLNQLSPAFDLIVSESQRLIDQGKARADLMSGIDYQSATLGMSALNKSLLDITRSTEAAIQRATELGATENELTRIRDAGTRQAALQAAIDGTSSAMSAVTRAIDAQRKIVQVSQQVAQQQVTSVRTVMDEVGGAVQRLRGQVSGASAADAVSGNNFIAQALATASASGYLPDAKQLQDAISSAMSGIDSTVYASQVEADRARLVLAGQLSQLGEVGGGQLTIAEQQLKATEGQITQLDAQLTTAQAQLDTLNGIRGGVVSVADSMSALASAIAAQQALSTTSLPVQSIAQAVPMQYTSYTAPDIQSYLSQSGVDGTTQSGAQQIYDAIASRNVDPYAVGSAYGLSRAETDAYLARHNIARLPGFDVGTNYVPRDMVAQIHEGEAIVPKAYNPAAGGVGNGARLERLVETLTSEVRRLQGLIGETNHNTRRTADAVNGNPDQPTLVQVVA